MGLTEVTTDRNLTSLPKCRRSQQITTGQHDDSVSPQITILYKYNNGDTCTRTWYRQLVYRNCYQKLARKIWHKFITVSCTKTTLQPITLHGSCHVPRSFCDGIELCSISCQKLLPEETDTRLTDTHASFWYQTAGTSFWCVCCRHKTADHSSHRWSAYLTVTCLHNLIPPAWPLV